MLGIQILVILSNIILSDKNAYSIWLKNC